MNDDIETIETVDETINRLQAEVEKLRAGGLDANQRREWADDRAKLAEARAEVERLWEKNVKLAQGILPAGAVVTFEEKA